MSFLKQTIALTMSSLQSIGERRGSSLVTVIGVTSVVGVLVSLLARREGTTRLDIEDAGADSVVVLGRGAPSAAQSVVSRETVLAIADAPGLKRTSEGKPYVMAVTLVSVDAIRRNGKRGTVLLAGFTDGATLVQPDIRIVEGRMYKPAVHELVVSDPIRKMFRGMEVGTRITFRGIEWSIVGVFAGNDPFGDSLLRADAETVGGVSHVPGRRTRQSGHSSGREDARAESRGSLFRLEPAAQFRRVFHWRRDGGGCDLRRAEQPVCLGRKPSTRDRDAAGDRVR
jgi:putative ABC transport system permease protein